jgi:thiol-disulfide isomerase/thioredoxin
MMKKTSLILCLVTLFWAMTASAQKLKTGSWRFHLKTALADVPFVMKIKKTKNGYRASIKNGKETIQLNEVAIINDKVIIPLQTYELSIELELPKDETVTGFLVRHNKNPKVKTPLIGVHNERKRFPQKLKKPGIDLSGKWAVTLTDEEEKTEKGVIVFEQKGNYLSGSILTPTGDYRYMEGYVSNGAFEAASFDGVYNYLVKGSVKNGKLEAKVLSNLRTLVEGKRDPNAQLPDAYKQTQIEKPLTFSFPDLEGKKVSLDDPKFKGKPVVVQFFGSWCPNCLDEMSYLIPWYNENHQRGIEIVALAFERSLSPQDAKFQLLKTQKKKNVPYTILQAGSISDDKPKDKIPGLKNFISFPTTVFLNKNHEVVKVHAGFTGPSTGKFFEDWKKEFNETVDGLLK